MRLSTLLALVALFGCATATPPALPELAPAVEPAPESLLRPGQTQIWVGPSLIGFTICTTRPISWLREDVSESDLANARAHEADHRAMMGEHPSCADYWRWFHASVENQIASEARAFCAGARSSVSIGREPALEDAVRAQAWNLFWYGFGLDLDQSAAAIRENGCAERMPPAADAH